MGNALTPFSEIASDQSKKLIAQGSQQGFEDHTYKGLDKIKRILSVFDAFIIHSKCVKTGQGDIDLPMVLGEIYQTE